MATLLGWTARRPRCLSFTGSKAACDPDPVPAPDSLVGRANTGQETRKARRARKECVESMERDISRRLEASASFESPSAGVSGSNTGSTRATLCSREGPLGSEESPHSDSTRRVSEDSTESLNVAALRDSAELASADTKHEVQRAITALSNFVRSEQTPGQARADDGAARPSYRRSSSQDSLCSDADDGPEEPPPDAPSEPPQQHGMRRTTSLPVPEVPKRRADVASRADARKQAKRLHRSASLDLGGDRVSKHKQAQVVRKLKLKALEAGARNRTKWRRRTMWNQCFYLSIAHAYMGTGDNVRQTKRLARRLRYAIEAAVLEKHPSWSKGLRDSAAGTGPAMVFADFLQIAMRVDGMPRESNFLSRLAVCVLDSAGGHAEVYIGPEYGELSSREELERNFILLLHVPGHYCCLVRDDAQGSKLGMTYPEFRDRMAEQGVLYIETMA